MASAIRSLIEPVIRQKCVRRHVITLQRVHNGMQTAELQDLDNLSDT
jgi:hypothetical protein